MAITGRFVLLAALGIVLAPIGGWALWTYVAVLLVVAGVDLSRAARIASIELTRKPLDSVRLGEVIGTELRLTNVGRRTGHLQVRDAWVPSAGADPYRQRLALGPGERRTIRTELRPTRRGERPASVVTIRSIGPLGLAGRQRRIAVPGALRVLPSFASRKFLPEKLSRLRQIDGAVLMRQRGQGSEFDSLREYVIGDDVRAIDWRASARAADVMVRTWRPERDRIVVLAIDTGRTSAARIGDEPRLDAALDASLLLAAVAGRAGDRVGLVAADLAVRSRLAPASAGDVLPKLVGALTPLEPALVETDPQLLAAEVLQLVSRRSLVVLFSSLDSAAAGTGLLPAVRSLIGRHRVVVASVTDPRLAELAADRTDSAAVYAAGAAELARSEQRRVADELVRLGATVVDAAPERFAPAVTDAYLDLKAAGRL